MEKGVNKMPLHHEPGEEKYSFDSCMENFGDSKLTHKMESFRIDWRNKCLQKMDLPLSPTNTGKKPGSSAVFPKSVAMKIYDEFRVKHENKSATPQLSKYQAMKQKITSLEKECEGFEEDSKAMYINYKRIKKEKYNLEEECDETHRKYNRAKKEIITLKEKLRKYEKKINTLKEKNITLKKKMENLNLEQEVDREQKRFEQDEQELMDPSCFNNYDDYEIYLEQVVPPEAWFYPPDPIISVDESLDLNF